MSGMKRPPTEAALNLRVWLKAKLVDNVLRFKHSVVSSGGVSGSALVRGQEVNGPVPSRWIGGLDYGVVNTPVFQLHGSKLNPKQATAKFKLSHKGLKQASSRSGGTGGPPRSVSRHASGD